MSRSSQTPRCLRLGGRLMMLPREEEIAESFASTQDIETGIFNHPVVVISRQVHQGNVAVLVVSSRSQDHDTSR